MLETQKIERTKLTDGLPKQDAFSIIEELKEVLYSVEGNMQRFFPEAKEKKYKDNFALFDRDNDGHINLSELKELLISINMTFTDDELEELYNELNSRNPDKDGITDDAVFVLVSKKIRDNDQ